MELTNKRTQYTVTETGNDFKLQGELSVNETQNTFTLNGSFQNVDGSYLGTYSYSQRAGEIIDKNISGIRKQQFAAVEAFLDGVIAAIIDELEQD